MTRAGFTVAILASCVLIVRADNIAGKVVCVDDGDTLRVAVGTAEPRPIRIYGIDCPEGDQPYADEARDFASGQCLGAMVNVHVISADRFGRPVGTVLLSDGTDLGFALLEKGLAWCYPPHGTVAEAFKGAEIAARNARLGLWADAKPVPPSQWKRRDGQSSAVVGSELTGTVVAVSDGDTLTLLTATGEHVIRLHGVDCPEGGRAFSEAACAFTRDLCLEKPVTVQVRQRHDRYGRIVGTVSLGEGKELGLRLVEAGLAWWLRASTPEDRQLQEAEALARAEKRGLWEDDNPKPPWEK